MAAVHGAAKQCCRCRAHLASLASLSPLASAAQAAEKTTVHLVLFDETQPWAVWLAWASPCLG